MFSRKFLFHISDAFHSVTQEPSSWSLPLLQNYTSIYRFSQLGCTGFSLSMSQLCMGILGSDKKRIPDNLITTWLYLSRGGWGINHRMCSWWLPSLSFCICQLNHAHAVPEFTAFDLWFVSSHSLVVAWRLCDKEEKLLVCFHKPYRSFRREIPKSLQHYFVRSEMVPAYCPLKRKTYWNSYTIYRIITKIKLR